MRRTFGDMETCYAQRQQERQNVRREMRRVRERSARLIELIRERDWSRWEAGDHYSELWRQYHQVSQAMARVACPRLIQDWRATTHVVHKVYEYIDLRT